MLHILNFQFSLIELICFAVLMLSFSYQLYFYIRYIRVVLRSKKIKRKTTKTYAKGKLPVSVIITARNQSENLRKFLPLILTQNYPEYEVIVVNDGADEDTKDLLELYTRTYPQLRTTFVPSEANNRSTKKLALTLGVKAAKYDWLLFTEADCFPDGENWIQNIARNFIPENEFVLAYSAYSPKRSLINKLITFDNLFNALRYLGYAKVGKPYMGVGRNIAYKKEVFFKQNGFASNLHLVEGDAELMVNYAANKQNTDIEVSAESLTWSQPAKSFKAWYFQKEKALSITTFYRAKSKFLLFAEPFARLLFYASFITLTILSLLMGNWPLSVLAGLIFIGRLCMQIRIINKTSSYFKGQKYYLSLLLFDIILPVIALVVMTFGRIGSKSKHISWK